MQFKRRIELINGQAFLVLPAKAMARLKAKLGDELEWSETSFGVALHIVQRSPAVHRKRRPKRR